MPFPALVPILTGAAIGGGISAVTGNDPLKGALIGGATSGLGAAGAMPNLFSGGGLLSGGAGAVPTANASMASTLGVPAAPFGTPVPLANEIASQGGAMTADQFGVNTLGQGGEAFAGVLGDTASKSAASSAGALTKTQMDNLLLQSGNMTAPPPGLLDKTKDFLGMTPDPYGPEAALKANQIASALPEDKPGFTSQLTTGLLSNAGSFVPDREPIPTPQTGPSLRQGQAQAPQSLFSAQYSRRRR